MVALPDNIQLIITDLSIPERTSPMLERFAHVIIIDHHITTQWAVGWAESTGNEAIVDTSRCATWLTYEYMKSVYGFGSEKMTCWARLIDDYDRYVLQYPESRRLNVLFNITADPIRFVRDGMEKHPETLLNRESDDIDYYLEQQRKYIDKSTMFVLNYKP